MKTNPPCLSNEAMTLIEIIKENPSDHDLLDKFFNTFGTHAILEVNMGNKFVSKTKFSREEMYVQKSQGRSVEFEASAGGWGYSGSAGGKI